MWIERQWEAAVRALARAFPAVLVTGPRQVGKTSLLRHLYPEVAYVSLDDPGLARQAETTPELLFDANPGRIILDEVQYAPSLFRTLKRRIDQSRGRGRFLLTGSQTFPLMQNVAESLAGRCGILEMNSLSWSEARAARPQLGDLEFLVTGGFPALHTGAFERPSDFYASYLATYLERDVRNIRNVGDLRDFDRLLRAAALRTGQLLSYSDLARDVGITPNTAKSWISVLQASGQILLLEPYHRNLTSRLVKSPKLYFLDTGLACYLVGLHDATSLLASPIAGAMWETFVVAQIVRHYQVERSRPPLWFWRTSTGHEVDVIVERGGRFLAFECKLASTVADDDLRGIRALEAYYGEGSVARAFVVCRTAHEHGFASRRDARAISVDRLPAVL